MKLIKSKYNLLLKFFIIHLVTRNLAFYMKLSLLSNFQIFQILGSIIFLKPMLIKKIKRIKKKLLQFCQLYQYSPMSIKRNVDKSL